MTETVVTCRRCGHTNVMHSSLGSDVVDQIISTAADLFTVDADAIRSRSQRRRVVAARHAVCAVMRNDLHMSYPDIGAALDRDHTTVIASVRRCDPTMMVTLSTAVRRFLPN